MNASGSPSSRRPFLRGLLAGSLFGALTGGAVGALAQDGPRGCHGRVGWWRHGTEPEAMKAHLARMADKMLDKLDASGEQRERIKAALAKTVDDLAPLRSRHENHRNEIAASLSQPEIDRGALEQLRKAELSLAESASAILVASAADIAETLTPEQRSQLAEMAKHWRGRHRG